MEARTITVKGVGKATSRPDQITIPITLEAKDFDYQEAMQQGVQQHDALKSALGECGIPPEEIKTTDFRVNADYERERDENGSYKRIFDGYTCMHQLQVQFVMDLELLGRVLGAIARCAAQPCCSVHFSVRDAEPMMREALKNAAANAREKAGILAAASGVTLGALIHIDYSWADVTFRSETSMACAMGPLNSKSMNIEIEPKDIAVTKNVTFVWEIG